MTGYSFHVEQGCLNLIELFPLYAQHYHEMSERLKNDGHPVSPFNPRVDAYIDRWKSGSLINYVARDSDGKAVGYSNVYVTNDMHNQDLIAQEDTIFVLKAHRNGVGRKLVRFVLDDLKKRGVKRANVTALTDLRVAKVWQRMGFKHVADAMTYYIEEV